MQLSVDTGESGEWLGAESAMQAQADMFSNFNSPRAERAPKVRAGVRVEVRFGRMWTGGTVVRPHSAMQKAGIEMWEVRFEDGVSMPTTLGEATWVPRW